MFSVTYQPYQFIIKISDFCLDNWATIYKTWYTDERLYIRRVKINWYYVWRTTSVILCLS